MAIEDRNLIVRYSGRMLEMLRGEHVVLAMRIRCGVRIDRFRGLEGIAFKLDVGTVELGGPG